ncbi:hypothetical protein E4T56_gene17138 [Termitomyces sp. T112]|nr:hypothetical protein E4T56_gene17138 [Termitomyces sp. T112]
METRQLHHDKPVGLSHYNSAHPLLRRGNAARNRARGEWKVLSHHFFFVRLKGYSELRGWDTYARLVVWGTAIAALQHTEPDAVSVVCSEDTDASKSKIVSARFDITLNSSGVHFVFLDSRSLVERQDLDRVYKPRSKPWFHAYGMGSHVQINTRPFHRYL